MITRIKKRKVKDENGNSFGYYQIVTSELSRDDVYWNVDFHVVL